MRLPRLLAILLIVVGAGFSRPGSRPVSAQEQPTFKSTPTRIVSIFATVLDSGGRIVPGLQKEDFTVLDNNKPQELVVFDNSVRPFNVVVMLDQSGSMTLNLELVKAAAEQFVMRMLPADKGQVGGFSDKIQLSGTFTNDRDELIAALDDIQFGNPTRLYDAINESMAELTKADGRKVVLVFTDGDDTSSHMGLGDVLDRARDEEVMVYAIGLQSEYRPDGVHLVRTRPDRGLKRLAEETGGGYFELKKTDDLAPTFTRVAQELHSQYTLGFTPQTLDNKEHKLVVRLRSPEMTARARKSYIASTDRESNR